MAGNTAETVFTGNAKQLEAEYKKIEAAKDRDIAKLKQQLEESRKAAQEEIRLKQRLGKAIEGLATPQQKYIKAMDEYDLALKKGLITEQQHQRLRQKELATLNELSAATKRSAVQTTSNTSSMLSWGSALSSATAAVTAMVSAVTALAQAKRELRKENEQTVFSIDEASRSYAVQVGLTTDAQRIEARDRILKTGRDNAVLPQQAFAAATALQGAGITDERALDFFLKMRASSNETDSDPEALAKGMAQFLGSMGQAKSFENFEDLGQRMRGMFGNEMSAAVQVQQLSDFTAAAPAFAMTNTSTKDGLAMLAVLTGTQKSSSVAATGASAIVTKLAAGQGGEALKKMGLKTTDVDMVGETLFEALDRIKQATDKMPQEKRQSALAELFGQEQLDAGLNAINNVDQMRKIAASQIDRAAFDAGVTMKTTGASADMKRAEASKAITAVQFEDKIARGAVVDKMVETQRMERVLEREGVSGATETILEEGLLGKVGFNSAIDNSVEAGLLPENYRSATASQMVSNLFVPFTRQAQPQKFPQPGGQPAAGVVDQQMAEQTAVLRDIRDKLTPLPGSRQNPATTGRPDR